MPNKKAEYKIIEWPDGRRVVRGISGIMTLFGVSRSTAMRYRQSILADAIFTEGRIIWCDVDKALELITAKSIQ